MTSRIKCFRQENRKKKTEKRKRKREKSVCTSKRALQAHNEKCHAQIPLKFIGLVHIQWSQKVSFRPETGPEFPQNDQNPKHFGITIFPDWSNTPLILSLVFRFFRQKYFACFGVETYFLWPLYVYLIWVKPTDYKSFILQKLFL